MFFVLEKKRNKSIVEKLVLKRKGNIFFFIIRGKQIERGRGLVDDGDKKDRKLRLFFQYDSFNFFFLVEGKGRF